MGPSVPQAVHILTQVSKDSGVASARSVSTPQPSTPNAKMAMSPSSSRAKHSHSVSQSADSASYYVDGSIDQISPVNSPVKSHDFAGGRRPEFQSPKSNRLYLNGQDDYESGAPPFSPSDTNNTAPRISDSSSMFGAVPNTSLLHDAQPPFSVNGTEKEVVNGGTGMPGTFHETPKLSKTNSPKSKKLSDASYFDHDGELKKEVGNARDDVSIGEAF